MDMSTQHDWYTLIPQRDRMVVDAAAKWLRPIQWHWFITLTFPWNVKGEAADVKLKERLNLKEWTLKTGIYFVADAFLCWILSFAAFAFRFSSGPILRAIPTTSLIQLLW
jgi:hypothetical protein